MKYTIWIFLLFMFTIDCVTAQVAITTDASSPDNSAMLDVISINKGMLLPRMTQTQKLAIPAPATGLIIYQTDGVPGFYYNRGTSAITEWVMVGTGSGQWSSSGTNIFYSSGNVGIGTNTPYAILDVYGDAKINELTVGRGGGNNSLNTAIGNMALRDNISGSLNTAIGFGTMHYNKAGSRATALGTYALYKSNSQVNDFNSDNVAIGYASMFGPSGITATSTGIENTAVGSESLNVISSGSSNVAIGYHSGYINSSGFQNTALGANSLVNNTTGSYNTAIGYNTGPNAGNLANSTTLGIDATGTATDQVRIGNVFVNSIGGYANWSNISDGRFKEDVKENVPGLNFISQLRPVTYRLNRNAINAFTGADAAYKGEAMSGITSGFVAQEVEKAAQLLGYDFSGVDAPKNDKDVYALRYSDFVVPLVKAVQELKDIVDRQQKEIEELKAKPERTETH